MRNRVECPSVCLSHHSTSAAAGLLLSAVLAGDIYRQRRSPGAQRRSTALSSKCGQCHVDSWRRRLNTDWCKIWMRRVEKSTWSWATTWRVCCVSWRRPTTRNIRWNTWASNMSSNSSNIALRTELSDDQTAEWEIAESLMVPNWAMFSSLYKPHRLHISRYGMWSSSSLRLLLHHDVGLWCIFISLPDALVFTSVPQRIGTRYYSTMRYDAKCYIILTCA